jgi:putative transposase
MAISLSLMSVAATRNDASPYRGYRSAPEIIAHAVWLYFRFRFRFHLSFRDVQDLHAELGVVVSRESIRQWCTRFGASFAAGLRDDECEPATSGIWTRWR